MTYVIDLEVILSPQWTLCSNGFLVLAFVILPFPRITSVLFQCSLNFCKLFMWYLVLDACESYKYKACLAEIALHTHKFYIRICFL